jgi:Family of unknown function (DUF6843)/Carboxypeptidase regulatory-like domain
VKWPDNANSHFRKNVLTVRSKNDRGSTAKRPRGLSVLPMKNAVAKAVVLLFVTLASSAKLAAAKGAIRGRVIDQDGNPIAGANVHAELHGVPMAKAIQFVQTDSAGLFTIDRLDFGTYDVNGEKEEDGYPETHWALYADKPAASATVSAEKPTAEVELKFGPKAAVIVGSVRDAVTGKPLNSAFEIARDKNGSISTSAPPEFRFLIPSNTPVELEVSAPGYATWRYNEAFRGSSLNLLAADERRLDIVLEPAPDASRKPSKFLLPAGYVGWLLLEYGVNGAPPVPEESGANVFEFPSSGRLKTSSSGPVDGAPNSYFYYSKDGSVVAISSDYWNGNGMIWGEHPGTAHGQTCMFGFFVGTREEYERRKHDGEKGIARFCQ